MWAKGGRHQRNMKFAPTLYAERLEGHVRYRLEVPERNAGRPPQEEFNHRLDQATIVALRRSADASLRSKETTGFVDEARRRGSVLYRTLLPARLRDQLKVLSGPMPTSLREETSGRKGRTRL